MHFAQWQNMTTGPDLDYALGTLSQDPGRRRSQHNEIPNGNGYMN